MTASPSASPTPSVTPTATLAVGPGLGAIDVSYIYLTTGRIGHDLDNGRLRLVAHVDDTTAAALPTRLMQESLALRVYDSTGAFDVTLPLSRCQARGRAVTCQPGLGSLARLALTPIPGAPGSWRLRVYARRLTDLATGPVGSTRNPYVAPVVVELGGQSGSIEACKPVYRTALRCRR